MHLALPTRKSSNASLYKPRTSRIPTIRRSRVQAALISICAVGALFFLVSHIIGGETIPSGTPPVVIVTVLSTKGVYSNEYLEDIKDNRVEYAKKRGKLERLCVAAGFKVLIGRRICCILPHRR